MDLREALDIIMFAVACGVLLIGYPVAFTLGGVALIFAGIGYATGVFDPSFLYAMPQRIFGTMTNEVLIAVPLFIFMGVMLERSRVAEELLDTMGKVLGSVRGGLGIAVSVVGALLAASTGIVGATVVTMGLLSLPTMLRRGYDPALAAGSICAAGTLGQIIPPSIVLVLLGDVLSSSYQQAQLALGNYSPDHRVCRRPVRRRFAARSHAGGHVYRLPNGRCDCQTRSRAPNSRGRTGRRPRQTSRPSPEGPYCRQSR